MSETGPIESPSSVVKPVEAQREAKDVRSLFSKKKAKPTGVVTLPPPPPPPAPKVHSEDTLSADEGWEREYQKLEQTLNEHQLKITKVDADGSCLFSAFACHIQESTSETLRNMAVDFMLSHRDDFAPFIDEEAYPNGFDDYCARMRRSTTWGGQLEIQALSRALEVNVYVFQTGGKSTVKMINFDESTSQCVTVSYHDGEHYNTVLPLEGDQMITVTWLESMFTPIVSSGYVDSNPVAKVQRGRKKVGLFN